MIGATGQAMTSRRGRQDACRASEWERPVVAAAMAAAGSLMHVKMHALFVSSRQPPTALAGLA